MRSTIHDELNSTRRQEHRGVPRRRTIDNARRASSAGRISMCIERENRASDGIYGPASRVRQSSEPMHRVARAESSTGQTVRKKAGSPVRDNPSETTHHHIDSPEWMSPKPVYTNKTIAPLSTPWKGMENNQSAPLKPSRQKPIVYRSISPLRGQPKSRPASKPIKSAYQPRTKQALSPKPRFSAHSRTSPLPARRVAPKPKPRRKFRIVIPKVKISKQALMRFAVYVGIIVLAYFTIKQDWLALRRVDVTGNSQLSQADVVQLASLDNTNGVWAMAIPRDRIRRGLESNPMIESANVSLDGPFSLRIQVRERQPVAALEANKSKLVFDRTGELINVVQPTGQYEGRIVKGVPPGKTHGDALVAVNHKRVARSRPRRHVGQQYRRCTSESAAGQSNRHRIA